MHLLLDVDSKIPNLALLKISRYLKSRGKQVVLVQLGKSSDNRSDILYGDIEKVWISVVFTWNKVTALVWKMRYEKRGVPVEIGGTGISLKIKLPPEIEQLTPDYELYKIWDKEGRAIGFDDRAIGFMQRGCIRACDFCIVHEKEGWLKDNRYNPLSDWVPSHFNKVLLLDNEFAAFPEDEPERTRLLVERKWNFATTQQAIMEEARSKGWKLSITQGYDLRCVTEGRANILAEYKPWDLKFHERRLYVAWDYFGIEPLVRTGLERLTAAGLKGREIMCYVLVGKKTTHLQDYYRFHVLWKQYKVYPFLMRYNMRKDDRFLNALSRYVNRGPASYRGHSFLEYCERRAPDLQEEARNIIEHCESGKPIPMNMLEDGSLPMVAMYE